MEGLTDNRNRTASDVRAAFSKYGGSLGETNSVSFMFRRLGVITYPLSVASEYDMLEAAIEAGAENAVSTETAHEITCEVEAFFTVRDSLETRFGEPESAKLDWRPENTVSLMKKRPAPCSSCWTCWKIMTTCRTSMPTLICPTSLPKSCQPDSGTPARH